MNTTRERLSPPEARMSRVCRWLPWPRRHQLVTSYTSLPADPLGGKTIELANAMRDRWTPTIPREHRLEVLTKVSLCGVCGRRTEKTRYIVTDRQGRFIRSW